MKPASLSSGTSVMSKWNSAAENPPSLSSRIEKSAVIKSESEKFAWRSFCRLKCSLSARLRSTQRARTRKAGQVDTAAGDRARPPRGRSVCVL